MKRRVLFAPLVALAACAASCDALAVGGIAQVSIIDRSSGVELVPHYYHGEYWVAGTPGAAYAIEIRNRLGERILAVTSVDGVNVVSGATAGWDQQATYSTRARNIRSPAGARVTRKLRPSHSPIRQIHMPGAPEGLRSIGIIGVALFRERQPQRVEPPQVMEESSREQQPSRSSNRASAPNAPASAASSADSRADLNSKGAIVFQAPEAKLGTGHGERETSYVNHTDFNRLQPEPNEVIRIHYDSFNNLVAMGIVKRPRPSIPTADPFPAFAP